MEEVSGNPRTVARIISPTCAHPRAFQPNRCAELTGRGTGGLQHHRGQAQGTGGVGGGQAGSAAGYYLRRAGLDFVILDGQDLPGGAWRHAWPSLRLFSPARYSSLPGRMMPAATDGGYPTASDTVAYLADYQHRYRTRGSSERHLSAEDSRYGEHHGPTPALPAEVLT